MIIYISILIYLLSVMFLISVNSYAPTKFYLLGFIIHFPIFWGLSFFLDSNSSYFDNAAQIMLFLLLHSIIILFIINKFWIHFKMDDYLKKIINDLKFGKYDQILFLISIFIYLVILYRYFKFGILITGVAIPTEVQTSYLQTILWAIHGFLFPSIIIWPFLRFKNSSGFYKLFFLILIFLSFLISFSFGRTAMIVYATFVFLFFFEIKKIFNVKNLFLIISISLIIIFLSNKFFEIRINLNNYDVDTKTHLIENINNRATDLIRVSDQILDSNTVKYGAPYFINSIKRTIPSFLIKNCDSNNCDSKIKTEKIIQKNMSLPLSDSSESIFSSLLADKSILLLIFQSLIFSLLILFEFYVLKKIFYEKGFIFFTIYAHLGYSLLKIDQDTAWYFFHLRDSIIVTIILYLTYNLIKFFSNISKINEF